MHDINLQRVDRMTMAHGLEGRVPFLDTSMIELAMTIPADLKLRDIDGRRIEKWILRKTFEDLLPDDIVWRDKAQFDEGSGLADLLAAEAAERDVAAAGRSPEEAYYRETLASAFEVPEPVLSLVAHWNDRPAGGISTAVASRRCRPARCRPD